MSDEVERKLEVHAGASTELICPYCKDDLGDTGVIFCGACRTIMHRECYAENKGCTTFGCERKEEQWPKCIHCFHRLRSPYATVCVQCGYDLRRNTFHLRTDVPSVQWAVPKWAAFTEHGRLRKEALKGRRSWWAWMPKPSPLFFAGLVAMLAFCGMPFLTRNPSLIPTVALMLPLWVCGLVAIYFLNSE